MSAVYMKMRMLTSIFLEIHKYLKKKKNVTQSVA